ncbi:MAG TPA: metallophosphoesterase [Nocardioidaceae bacterium]|nr:metallophosphoesterase [Nocardioidaceae bacterium]
MQALARTALGATAVGAAGLGYAAGYEVRAFTLRRFDVPVLPAGSTPLRVLHVSDLHLTPSQRRKIRWVQGLAALEPDLVVNTGDNLAHRRAVPAVIEAMAPLLALPGVFVLGSNDYYAPVAKNPARYLLSSGQTKTFGAPTLPWEDLRDAFVDHGWRNLTNTHDSLTVAGSRLAFVGVDDPHLDRDDLGAVAGSADDTAALAIAVAHAPYLRVLDQFTADGYGLVLAGHTHGGQLTLPLKGALVTNCDLDTKRVKGVSRHRAQGRSAWLHVSAGLGTSPYAPVRFGCRPEATLLTLRPVS